MVIRRAAGALTNFEKRIVKALLRDGERNQDIQALLNIGRVATINSARITEVKQDRTIEEASADEVDFFNVKQKHYDPLTGLNLYDDERLIRARESMVLAVQVFNSPTLRFKTEVFAMLANVAWTYLLHEHYERNGVPIIQEGRSMLLSQMTARGDCPLSQGMKDNLAAIKEIRDQVEHTLFRRADLRFLSIFQACCLNFDKVICDIFGKEKSLKHELNMSLQFAKLDVEQAIQIAKYDIPPQIEALDQRLESGLSEEQLSDIEYRFRVVYTFENSTKSKAHIKFVHPGDEGADDVKNVLIKNEISDKLFPHKPSVAAALIKAKSGRKFTQHNHTQAWRKFDCRPKSSVVQPENTNRDYCIYHTAHGDYTYSDKWVEFVTEYISDDQNYQELLNYRIS